MLEHAKGLGRQPVASHRPQFNVGGRLGLAGVSNVISSIYVELMPHDVLDMNSTGWDLDVDILFKSRFTKQCLRKSKLNILARRFVDVALETYSSPAM